LKLIDRVSKRVRSTIGRLVSVLKISEESAASMLAEDPLELTKRLISLLSERQRGVDKDEILVLLYHVGDLDMTAELYGKILKSDADPGLKLIAATWGQLSRLRGHPLLRDAIDAHLQGESPVTVWSRTVLPYGCRCLHKKKADTARKPPMTAADPATKKKIAKVLAFKPQGSTSH